MVDKLELDELERLLETMEPDEIEEAFDSRLDQQGRAFLATFSDLDTALRDLKHLEPAPEFEVPAPAPVVVMSPGRAPAPPKKNWARWALPLAAVMVFGILIHRGLPPALKQAQPNDTRAMDDAAAPATAVLQVPETEEEDGVLEEVMPPGEADSGAGVSRTESRFRGGSARKAEELAEKESAVNPQKASKVAPGLERHSPQLENFAPVADDALRPAPLKKKASVEEDAPTTLQSRDEPASYDYLDQAVDMRQTLEESTVDMDLGQDRASRSAGLGAAEAKDAGYSARVVDWIAKYNDHAARGTFPAELFTADARIHWPWANRKTALGLETFRQLWQYESKKGLSPPRFSLERVEQDQVILRWKSPDRPREGLMALVLDGSGRCRLLTIPSG